MLKTITDIMSIHYMNVCIKLMSEAFDDNWVFMKGSVNVRSSDVSDYPNHLMHVDVILTEIYFF